MAESFAWVIVYSLNCDEPQHDRKEFAKLRCSDPDGDEFEFHNGGTATQARASARKDGWTIRRDGTVTCPMCNAKRRERRPLYSSPTMDEVRRAATRVVEVYQDMEDANGDPFPDIAALRRALAGGAE